MAAVSVKIHGLDVTLSTDANYGNLPVLLEVPEISSARFKIGDPVSSDQSTSLRCASTPELRQKLLQVSTDAYNIPRWLAYPVKYEDEEIIVTNGAMLNPTDKVWIRSEKMQITSISKVPLSDNVVTAGFTKLSVVRAIDGTARGSYQMDDFEGTKGPLVSIGVNAFPTDVIGLWATVRIHRDHSEKCLNPKDSGHYHLNQPCSREVFTGRISRIADAGDVVEIELQSGIQLILDTAIPKMCGIHPVSEIWRNNYHAHGTTFAPNKVRVAPTFARPAAGATSWERVSNVQLKRSIEGGPENWLWEPDGHDHLFCAGQFRSSAATGVRSVAKDVADVDPPVYTSVPKYPGSYDNWRAIIVEGSGGFTGMGKPSKARADASTTEYIPLAVSLVASPPSQRTGEFTYRLGAAGGVQPLNKSPMGWWYPGNPVTSLYNKLPYTRRTGRLDGGVKGGAEYRNPAVLRSGSYYKAYEWSRTSWAIPGASFGSFSSYVLGQLWTPGMPIPGGTANDRRRFTGYVDLGVAPPTAFCIDLNQTLKVMKRVDDSNSYLDSDGSEFAAAGNSNWLLNCHTLPYGALRRTDESLDTNIWLPETWVDRTFKDTVFTDQFQMNAIGWAPGKNGLFRPVWLADPNPEIVATITDDLLRDRDVTLDFEGNIPIGEVEVTGRHETPIDIVRDPADSTEEEGGQSSNYIGGATTTRIVSSDLLYGSQGRKVSVKMTNYLSRDGLPIAGNFYNTTSTGSGIPIYQQNPQRIIRYVEDIWRRVVNRFGSPVPSVTLRVDGDTEVYPGDYVNLKLSQIKDRNGRASADHPIVAMCVERGDRLDDATAEVEFLLVGWYSSLASQWHPGSLFWNREDGVLWEPFRTDTVFTAGTNEGSSPAGSAANEGSTVGWVADLSGNDNHLNKRPIDTIGYPYPTYNNRGIKFDRTTNWLVSRSAFNATLTEGITVATVYFKDNVNEIEILSSRAPGGVNSIPTVFSYPDPSMPWRTAGFAQYAGFGTGNTRGFGVRMKDPAYATTDPSTLGTHSYKQYLQAGPITSWNGKISTARYTPGTPSTNGVREYNMDGTEEGSIIGWTTDPAEPAASVQSISSSIRMGGMYSGNDLQSSATVRFALVINRVITPAERAQLEAYMRWVASI